MIDLPKLNTHCLRLFKDGCRAVVSCISPGGVFSDMSRVIFWVLLGTVLLSPVPFGSIYSWSYTLLAIIVAVLVGLWSVTTLISRTPPTVDLKLIWMPAATVAVLTAWIFLQSTPWVPAEWHHPVWREVAAALGQPVQGYISVNPTATENALMRLLTYAGIFFLALQYGRSAGNTHTVIYLIAAIGVVYAGYGLYVEFSGSESILWYDKQQYRDSLTSTFRYKNAYATYAGFGLLCTIGLLIRSLDRRPPAAPGFIGLLELVYHALARQWFLLICLVIQLSALVLSDSRAGLASFIIAIIALLLMSRTASSADRRNVSWSISGVLAIILGFTAMSGGGLIERIGTEDGTRDVRSIIYSQTINLIKDRPVLGTGYGTFADAFRPARTDELSLPVGRAHNSYLENLLELGAIGMAVLMVLFAHIAVGLAGFAVFAVTTVPFSARALVRDPVLGIAAPFILFGRSLLQFAGVAAGVSHLVIGGGRT